MKNEVSCYASDSRPFGCSYGNWTAKWWQWAASIPTFRNPVLDKTGENHNVDQPSSDVHFLAGIFGDVEKSHPTRKVTLHKNVSILFPVLNCEANSMEYPNLKTDADLIKHVSDDIKSVVKKDCFINDIRIVPELVKSDPEIFEITVPKDNVLGIEGEKTIRLHSSGYYTFLKPLPVGNYILDFEGSCENGRLCAGARYELKIIE
ncbi:MAG: hypothetical protein WCB31_09510 [Nitrososphaeraceae archaeon]